MPARWAAIHAGGPRPSSVTCSIILAGCDLLLPGRNCRRARCGVVYLARYGGPYPGRSTRHRPASSGDCRRAPHDRHGPSVFRFPPGLSPGGDRVWRQHPRRLLAQPADVAEPRRPYCLRRVQRLPTLSAGLCVRRPGGELAAPLSGLLVMLSFGLGTFPAMLMMGGVGRMLAPTWRQRGVWLAGSFILLLGLITLGRGVLPHAAHVGHAWAIGSPG